MFCFDRKENSSALLDEWGPMVIGSSGEESLSTLSPNDSNVESITIQREDVDHYRYNLPSQAGLRNERHKLVERQRREKTRDLVRDLQRFLPNSKISRNDKNPNINNVLQDTLEYLQTQEPKGNVHDSNCNLLIKQGIDPPQIFANPLNETSRQRHLFAFDNAPMGLVISGIDGNLLRSNKSFEKWFGDDRGVKGGTIFSLTSPQDLSKVMQVLRCISCVRAAPKNFLP